jgi:hypothetical protein
MKVKVSELQGAALDWAVALIEYPEWKEQGYLEVFPHDLSFDDGTTYNPSTNWEQGGPIIERCCINVYYDGGGYWCATTDSGDPPRFGPTPLIAAMRCYVASQMGAEIELPEEVK